MTTAKKAVMVGAVCVLLVGALVYSTLSRRAYHKVALIGDSSALTALMNDWRKAGEPQGEALEKFCSSYGPYSSFKPFIYTNPVEIAGTSFICLFAVEDARFTESGRLAVTRDGTIIWIGEKQSRVILSGRKGVGSWY